MDLSKKAKSITSEFLNILEEAYKIEAKTASKEQILEELKELAIRALNESKAGTAAYNRKRLEIINCKTPKELIRLLEKTIENGKNYDPEERYGR